MSHFSVAIISKQEDVENMLDPYWEGLEVEPYIYTSKEDLIKEFEEAKIAAQTDENSYFYRIQHQENRDIDFETATYEEFRKWFRKTESFDEQGNLLATYNPDSKWDWFEIGGRFSKMLLLKNGERTDSAKIKDIDFEGIKQAKIKHAEELWEKSLGEKDSAMKFFVYGIHKDDTKETYINRQSKFVTYSVLDEKGWHEPGKMGWFGMSSETDDEKDQWDEMYMDAFIHSADPESFLTIVDCHI